MKYFSIFSGIGGFECGISKSRYGESMECIGYSEIDGVADSIYRRNFPTHKPFGDATKIETQKIEDFELLVGGFPCQAFSIAGHRKGFDDCRGTLFFEIARILADKRPKYILLENVKGILSHKRGKTIQTIFRVLDELGYDVVWEIYNSKEFVPQNRERLFIKGHLRSKCRGEILHFRREDETNKEKLDLKSLPGTSLKQDKCMIRRLTPTECERLQGFKDGWTKYGKNGETIKDSNRYRCLGNAVTVNVVEHIMNNCGKQWYIQDRIYDSNGISPALTTYKSDYIIIIHNGIN